MFTLESLNLLPVSGFVDAVGDVFEHAPWVAEGAAGKRPFPTVAALHAAMLDTVKASPAERQLAFIRAHPELGSKVKRADLTADSQAEQGGLGLDRLSEAEFQTFSEAQRRLSGQIRHPLHYLRAPAHPGFDFAPVRAAARQRPGDRAAGGARRDCADHPAAPGRQGRRPRQAENRRPALHPCAGQCRGQAGAGRRHLFI